MTNLVDSFIQKQKANSPFLSLKDGESAVVKRLREIKAVVKTGYAGEEKEVLRFKCDVDTTEGVKIKDFENGTARFANEVQEKGIDIGDGFTITRTGEGAKTRYSISNVVKGTPAAAPAPAAPKA